MPSGPRVRVQGSSTVAALPDRAALRLEVSELAKTPEAALKVAGERADAVTALLRAAKVDDADWHTAGVQVGEEWAWKGGRSVSVGHRATARFTVTVRNLEKVNTIVSAAVNDAQARVSGPDWIVGPDNPARVSAYGGAAVDAKVRAESYAAALDLQLGGVIRIEEPLIEIRPGPQPRLMAMATPAGDAGGEPPATVHVGEVPIEATVIVTFALETGQP